MHLRAISVLIGLQFACTLNFGKSGEDETGTGTDDGAADAADGPLPTTATRGGGDGDGGADASGGGDGGGGTGGSTTGSSGGASSSGSDGNSDSASEGGAQDGDPCDLGGRCGPGLKCAPTSEQTGVSWSAATCVPVGSAAFGQSCTVEGHDWSGRDNCVEGSVCVPAIDGYECRPLCGAEVAPCGGTDTCEPWDSALPVSLCMPAASCDPVAPDCSPSEKCVPATDYSVFSCDVGGGSGAPFDPCSEHKDCFGASICGTCGGGDCCLPTCNVYDELDPCIEYDAYCLSLESAQGVSLPSELIHVGVCVFG